MINIFMRTADMAQHGPEIRERIEAHPDLPTVVLRASRMTYDRRFVVVTADQYEARVRQIVADVLDPAGEVERLAQHAWETTTPGRPWASASPQAQEAMRRVVGAILGEIR